MATFKKKFFFCIYVIITYNIRQRALYCTELIEYTCTPSCTVMYFRILYGVQICRQTNILFKCVYYCQKTINYAQIKILVQLIIICAVPYCFSPFFLKLCLDKKSSIIFSCVYVLQQQQGCKSNNTICLKCKN